MKKIIPQIHQHFETVYNVCVQKTRHNIKCLADTPQSYAWAVDGNYFEYPEGFYDIGNWTSSFFTGMALLAYETTRDRYFLQQVNRLSEAYWKKVFEHGMDTMHDLGFLYSLYAVAFYKLTGDSDHREIALKAADELAKRFVVNGGYIRAWGRMDDNTSNYAGLAIIDCMMNLPLLFWATQETGNHFYSDIAVKHADTTLQYFVRPDDSVCHAYRFDIASGHPLREDNYCGYAIGTHWARGTAWAIYGFALAYRYTNHQRYFDTSIRLAQKFVANLDDAYIPVWDFRLPPEHRPLRDASAAAIAACGLFELRKYEQMPTVLNETAEKILDTLCRPAYLDVDETCPGMIKNAQVGDNRAARAKNAYTSWGDYFFMEALSKKLYNISGYW